MKTPSILALSVLGLAVSCRATSHPTAPAELGRPSTAAAMERRLEAPGPIELETVVAADWVIGRAGLINLDHEHARAAGLKDGEEPIQLYFHVLRHPLRGTFIVDTGVETAQRTAPKQALLRGLLGQVMKLDRMKVHHGLGEWLRARGLRLDGVFLTHLHLDHVAGLRDVPPGTPIFAGPGETEPRSLQNLFVAGVMTDAFAGRGPLQEWRFEPDPSGRFAGIVDVFEDGSCFAIHAPGHTPGSTAYLVMSTRGPVLLVGDASHTDWGWTHGVEPGSFSSDREASAVSLARLHRLVAERPAIEVRLGHQVRSTGAQRSPQAVPAGQLTTSQQSKSSQSM